MITVHSIHEDKVIDGKVLVTETNYQLALDSLIQLVDKLDIQRNLQKSKLYERLSRDMVKGCVMPPLTLAFLSAEANQQHDKEYYENFINRQIDNAFVLDGIQRLNTLKRTYDQYGDELDLTQPLFLDIIICESKDKLLYRMITLNNGQKPMSARHQIEILAEHFLGGNDIPIIIQTEKQKLQAKPARAFHKADIVKAYIAFITGLLNYDNQKIIEQKMDELIAEKVLEYNLDAESPEFTSVLAIVSRLIEEKSLYEWFSVNNNFIGFAVGIRKSFDDLSETTIEEFSQAVEQFDQAFSNLEYSQIKLSRERRKLAEFFIRNYAVTKDYGELEFTEEFTKLV